MAETDDAAQAAGTAAYDRAEQSAWPPTEDDFRATGAAAGAAAGAVFGGPVGAAIGGVIGNEVGSFVYGIGDAIAGGLDPNRGAGDAPLFMQYVRTTVAPSPIRVAEQLAVQCRGVDDRLAGKLLTTPNAVRVQLDALARWGIALTEDGYAANIAGEVHRALGSGGPAGVARARPLVEAFQRQLFAASAARLAECVTYKQANTAPAKKSSIGTVIVLGIVSAVGVGLLQRFITRGKF